MMKAKDYISRQTNRTCPQAVYIFEADKQNSFSLQDEQYAVGKTVPRKFLPIKFFKMMHLHFKIFFCQYVSRCPMRVTD